MDLSLNYEERKIYVEARTFIHDSHIYWLDEKCSVNIPEYEGHYIVKLRINSEVKEKNI